MISTFDSVSAAAGAMSIRPIPAPSDPTGILVLMWSRKPHGLLTFLVVCFVQVGGVPGQVEGVPAATDHRILQWSNLCLQSHGYQGL